MGTNKIMILSIQEKVDICDLERGDTDSQVC
jgi:hypothetical protein